MFDLASIFGQGGADPGGASSMSFITKGFNVAAEQFMIGAEQKKLSTARDLEMTARDKAIRETAGREITSQSGRGENLDLETVANKTYEQELAKVVQQQEYSIASTALKDEKSMRLIGGLSEITVSAIAAMGGDAVPMDMTPPKEALEEAGVSLEQPSLLGIKQKQSMDHSPGAGGQTMIEDSANLPFNVAGQAKVKENWSKELFGA